MSEKNVKKPCKQFRSGTLNVSLWDNLVKNKQGKEFNAITMNIQRSYKDKEDKWQQTTGLRLQDLPRVILLLQEAQKFLLNVREAS